MRRRSGIHWDAGLWVPARPSIILPRSRALVPGFCIPHVVGAASSPPPTFVAAGTPVGDETTINVPYYAGLAADDIAFVWAACSAVNINTITGFTSLTQLSTTGGSSDRFGRLAWRRLTGGESGTVAVTFSGTPGGAVGVMIGCRDALASGTPYEGADTATGFNSASQTSATIATTVGNTLGLRFGYASSTSLTSPPSGWDERAEFGFTGEDGVILEIDSKVITSSGTEAASTRTLGGSRDWGVQTLALLPEA